MNDYQKINPKISLEDQFEAYILSLTTPPEYMGEQVAAWSTWMAWVEGDGDGHPTGIYSGRVAYLNPLKGEILMQRDLGRC